MLMSFRNSRPQVFFLRVRVVSQVNAEHSEGSSSQTVQKSGRGLGKKKKKKIKEKDTKMSEQRGRETLKRNYSWRFSPTAQQMQTFTSLYLRGY